MKIDKEKLDSNIEQIIANGVFNGEEVDITTSKILSEIKPIVLAAEMGNNIYDDLLGATIEIIEEVDDYGEIVSPHKITNLRNELDKIYY